MTEPSEQKSDTVAVNDTLDDAAEDVTKQEKEKSSHSNDRKKRIEDVECSPNDIIQSFCTAMCVRKNASQIQDIQQQINQAMDRYDLVALKHYHQTIKKNEHIQISLAHTEFVEMVLTLSDAVQSKSFNLESDPKEIEKLEDLVEKAQIVQLSGFYQSVYVDRVKCTIDCYKLWHRTFDSPLQRYRMFREFIDSVKGPCFDLKVVQELRDYLKGYEVIVTQKQKLEDAQKLCILEDLLDVILETKALGLDLKKIEAVKVMYIPLSTFNSPHSTFIYPSIWIVQ